MEYEKSGFGNKMSEIWRKMQVKFIFPNCQRTSRLHVSDIFQYKNPKIGWFHKFWVWKYGKILESNYKLHQNIVAYMVLVLS